MILTSKNLKPITKSDAFLAHLLETTKMNEDMNLGICPDCHTRKVREEYVCDSVDYHREFYCLNCGFTASE